MAAQQSDLLFNAVTNRIERDEDVEFGGLDGLGDGDSEGECAVYLHVRCDALSRDNQTRDLCAVFYPPGFTLDELHPLHRGVGNQLGTGQVGVYDVEEAVLVDVGEATKMPEGIGGLVARRSLIRLQGFDVITDGVGNPSQRLLQGLFEGDPASHYRKVDGFGPPLGPARSLVLDRETPNKIFEGDAKVLDHVTDEQGQIRIGMIDHPDVPGDLVWLMETFVVVFGVSGVGVTLREDIDLMPQFVEVGICPTKPAVGTIEGLVQEISFRL